jgi:hypothetical protein
MPRSSAATRSGLTAATRWAMRSRAARVSASITNPKNGDVSYDIEQKSDEVLEVKYEAKVPGAHIISITFNNEEIPQSPLKVNIEPDVDVGRIKVTGVDHSKSLSNKNPAKTKKMHY